MFLSVLTTGELPCEILASRAANTYASVLPFIEVIVFILIFILFLFGQSLIHHLGLRAANIFCPMELVYSAGQQHAIAVQDHPFCQAGLEEEPMGGTLASCSCFG